MENPWMITYLEVEIREDITELEEYEEYLQQIN